MDIITLNFTYTQNEYVKAERQYLVANKTIRKYDPILIAVFTVLSLCYLFLSSFSIYSIILLVIILIASAIGCYIYFCMPVLKYKHTSKFHEEYTLFFSKDGIDFKTPSIDSVLQWSVYSELWESDEFYFLIQVPRVYYTLIPKRAFRTPEDKQVFEQLGLSNIKNEKRKLNKEPTEKI